MLVLDIGNKNVFMYLLYYKPAIKNIDSLFILLTSNRLYVS